MVAAISVVANLAPGALSIGSPSDKLNHALAFGLLAILALWAFPKTRVLVLFAALVIFSAGIELCQSIFDLGRAPDLADWGAGVIATVPVLGLAAIYRLDRLKQ